MRQPHARMRGIATVWLVAVFMALYAFLALAIDTGYIVLTAQELQNGADAASLAAAGLIRIDEQQAREAAVQIAAANRAAGQSIQLRFNDDNSINGDIVIGVWDRDTQTFTANDQAPNAVRITTRRTSNSPGGPVGLLFSSALGVNSTEVERSAIAWHRSRDVVLVLDYSASMNDDSQLSYANIQRLGMTAVENNLRIMWTQLGKPTYGNLDFDPQRYTSSNRNNILRRFGLDHEPYPYPRGSWYDYIDYVRSSQIDSRYRYRYGMMTLIDYWNVERPMYSETPDLWKVDAQPITAVKDAVTVFLNYIQQADGSDEIGLVSYTYHDGGANIEKPLTQTYAVIEERSRQMQAGHYDHYTNIGAGIEKAIEELDRNGRTGTNKLIVVLSDGVANRPVNEYYGRNEARRQARDAARAEYRIMTISLGANADTDLMREIAQLTGGVHYNVPGSGSLEEVQGELVGVFRQIAAYQPIQLVR